MAFRSASFEFAQQMSSVRNGGSLEALSPPLPAPPGSVAFLFFIHFTLPAIECAPTPLLMPLTRSVVAPPKHFTRRLRLHVRCHPQPIALSPPLAGRAWLSRRSSCRQPQKPSVRCSAAHAPLSVRTERAACVRYGASAVDRAARHTLVPCASQRRSAALTSVTCVSSGWYRLPIVKQKISAGRIGILSICLGQPLLPFLLTCRVIGVAPRTVESRGGSIHHSHAPHPTTHTTCPPTISAQASVP